MIRLVGRRLIIPVGDTGEFTIPTLGTVNNGDVAVLIIKNKLTRTVIFKKEITATPELLTFSFSHEDTLQLEPGKYFWDIKMYHSPVYDEENQLIGGAEINSYYEAYRLPICEVRG